MHTTTIRLVAAGLIAGVGVFSTQASAQTREAPNPAAGEAFADATVLALSRFDFDPAAFDLWSALDLLGADVRDRAGEDIGEVEDVLFGAEGYALALIVELDEFLEIEEPLVSVPLSLLEVLPGEDAVRAPVAAEGLQTYTAFDRRILTQRLVSNEITGIAEDDLDVVRTAPDLFLLEEELLGEYAPLPGTDSYGYVHDLLFTPEGRLETVVVSATAGPFDDLAVPYLGPPATDEPSILDAEPFTADEMGIPAD